MWRNQSRYRRHVSRGLDRARRRAQVRSIPLDGSRLVLFSDLHRGMGDRADDFLACRKIYHAALGYYDHLEFELFLLGDVEELWERPLAGVIDHYEGTLALERKFFTQGRGHRLLGNHDESLEWAWNRAQIDRFTGEAPLRESLVLRWLDSQDRSVGEMMLVHGHQGIRYTWLDRMVVKRFWAPIQRLTGIRTGVPSADHSIRRTHETALYDWARTQENLLLVCGHTHHPVFMSAAWEQAILRDLDDLVEKGASEEEVAMKQAHLHRAAAELRRGKIRVARRCSSVLFQYGMLFLQRWFDHRNRDRERTDPPRSMEWRIRRPDPAGDSGRASGRCLRPMWFRGVRGLGWVILLGLLLPMPGKAQEKEAPVVPKTESAPPIIAAPDEKPLLPEALDSDSKGESDKSKQPDRYEKLILKDGTSFLDCRIIRAEPDGLLVEHSAGVAKLSFFDLSEAVQTEWGFDPFRAMDFYKASQETERAQRWRLFWERQQFESEQAKERDQELLQEKAEREWVPVEAEVIRKVDEIRFLARCKRITFQPTKTRSKLGFEIDGPPKRVLIPFAKAPVILQLAVEGSKLPKPGETWKGFVHPNGAGQETYSVRGVPGSASTHLAAPAKR